MLVLSKVKQKLTILNIAPRKKRIMFGFTSALSIASSTTLLSSLELTLQRFDCEKRSGECKETILKFISCVHYGKTEVQLCMILVNSLI